MVKCVIFDMDGLMFDSERVVGECLKQAAKEFSYIVTDEMRLELLGRNQNDIRMILKGHLGQDYPYEEVSQLAQKYSQDYYEKKGVPIKKGLIELLRFLTDNHIYTAVASSSDRHVILDHLKSTDTYRYIDYVVGGNQVSQSKPQPEIFLTACEHFGIQPEDALVLEDSRNGILAAHNGHIPVICIPDLVHHDQETLALTFRCVESLLDVLHIIESGEI